METNFKIAKFEKHDDVFTKVGYVEYTVSFLKGTKVHQLRIVVNGYLTKETINLISFKEGYKNKVLSAIKEYKENASKPHNIIKKKVTIDYIKEFYSKKVVTNVREYLISINKEESRDKLTEFGLIEL